jgi:O-antigen/teichoic acid export membrane protein
LRHFFAKNLLFIIALNALVKPVWIFAIDRTVQNRVGHASYGTFQALLNMSVIMQFLLDFGLNSYNTRSISRDPESFAQRFPVMLGIRIILMLLYMVVVLGIGWSAGYRGNELGLLCGTLLIQTLTILLLFIRSNVSAFQRFKADGILSIADRLLMIIVCGFLLLMPQYQGQFKIEWFVWAQVACYTVAIGIGFYLLWRITRVPLSLSFHFRHVKGMLYAAAPYASLIFFMSVYMRSDTTLIERLASKEEAGIYAAAYRQLDVSNMFAILFAGILLPLFGRMLSERQNVAPIVRLSTNLLLPLSILGSVIAWTAGTGIMHLLYPAAGPYDGRVFAWVMSCLPAYSMMYIYATLLTANGQLKHLNIQAGCAALLNVSLNCLLIPKYGAEAAAIVACITQWGIASSTIFFAARHNGLHTDLRWIAAQVSFAIVLAAVGYAAVQIWADWKPIAATLAISAAIMIPVFRFISPSALRLFLLRR